jgi:hypothetical protein
MCTKINFILKHIYAEFCCKCQFKTLSKYTFYIRSKICLFSTACRQALGPTQPPIQWLPEVHSPVVKLPGREADHSSSSNAEVKDGGAVTPLLIRFHGIVLN